MGCAGLSLTRRIGVAGLSAAAVVATLVGAGPAIATEVEWSPVTVLDDDADSPSGADCTDLSFPVHQFEGDSNVQRVFGQFCSRGDVDENTPVQVLIHGGTYNHAYWDWPYEPEKYSYVAAATATGVRHAQHRPARVRPQ